MKTPEQLAEEILDRVGMHDEWCGCEFQVGTGELVPACNCLDIIALALRNAREEGYRAGVIEQFELGEKVGFQKGMEEAAKIAEEHPLSWYDPNTIHRDIATQIRAAARAEREGKE